MAVSTKEGGKYSHDAEGSNTVVMVYARSEHGIRALKSHFMLKYLTVNCLSTQQSTKSTCSSPKMGSR